MKHCIEVALAMGPVPEQARLAALLHDSIEDGDITFEQLGLILAPYEAAAVDVVSRKEGESYDDYIARIARSENPLATAIKVADLRVNLARCEGDHGRLILANRYRKALEVLER